MMQECRLDLPAPFDASSATRSGPRILNEMVLKIGSSGAYPKRSPSTVGTSRPTARATVGRLIGIGSRTSTISQA